MVKRLQPSQQQDQIMTSSEAAAYLGLSQGELSRRARLGLVPYIADIPSKWRRYRKSELDSYKQKWHEEQELISTHQKNK